MSPVGFPAVSLVTRMPGPGTVARLIAAAVSAAVFSWNLCIDQRTATGWPGAAWSRAALSGMSWPKVPWKMSHSPGAPTAASDLTWSRISSGVQPRTSCQ
jgi:hypothetical protein